MKHVERENGIIDENQHSQLLIPSPSRPLLEQAQSGTPRETNRTKIHAAFHRSTTTTTTLLTPVNFSPWLDRRLRSASFSAMRTWMATLTES